MNHVTPEVRAAARDIYDRQQAVPKGDHEADMDLRAEWTQRVQQPILDSMATAGESLTFLTAFVVSSDIASAVRADLMVEDGMDPLKASHLVGSYARAAFLREYIEAGRVGWDDVDIISLWRDSDPDDTDPWWAEQWQDAVKRNGGDMLRDGSGPLPVEDEDTLYLYRGQLPGEAGLAWSTDRRVAVKFAKTGGGRSARSGGVVLEGRADPRDVLAFLTGRGESEVVILPENVVWTVEPI